MPDGSGAELLRLHENDGRPRPADGGVYHWGSRNEHRVSCVSSASAQGEGFIVLDANGTRHVFDVLTWRVGGVLHKGEYTQPKNGYYMLPSRITDRHGNWVNYSYEAGRLVKIESSDGRRIDLTWSNGAIVQATAHGRTWTYQYGSPYFSVIQPDGSSWQYAGSARNDTRWAYQTLDLDTTAECPEAPLAGPLVLDLEMRHPSGAVGTFQFTYTRHGRTGTPASACVVYMSTPVDPVQSIPHYELAIPDYLDNFALTAKVISGPGVAPMQWSYVYGGGTGGGRTTQSVPCMNCPQDKAVVVHAPDGSRTEHHFGTLFEYNDGRLLGVDTYTPAGELIASKRSIYMTDAEAAAQPFPDTYGAYVVTDDASSNRIRPVLRDVLMQDGETFVSEVSQFDARARPLVRGLGNSAADTVTRIESNAYHDDHAFWVIGQPSGRWVNGFQVEAVSYGPRALATEIRANGQLVQALGYGADGTVSTVTDGNGNTISLSSWKRGIPQAIGFPGTPEAPGGTGRTALVDDHGWIRSITDESGHITSYDYDPMGRLARLTHPSGDLTQWSDTLQSFEQVNVAEFGVPAGHWRQTVSTGQGRKISYFDALWRPLLTHEYDAEHVASTSRYQRYAYDHEGRVTFSSYPGSTAAGSSGVWSEYDVLGRPTSVVQDSELGLLTTTTQYLSGLRTQTTSPKGLLTITRHLAWGEPRFDLPVEIIHPSGDLTVIARNDLGKPTSITRRNASGGTAVTRHYAYRPVGQTLCKIVEPETGVTIQDFDGAGNLAWSASGLPGTVDGGCELERGLMSGRRVQRTYDARNRVQSLVFPDGLGNSDFWYTPTGQLAQAVVHNEGAGVVTSVYTYNKRGMVVGEAMGVGGVAWGLGYGFNGNGHLAVQTHHVSGREIDYAPNALGQATRVGSFALGALYHPNGALKQFTYGNGLVHQLEQNARGLPDRSRDGGAGADVYDESFDYDAHGNVAAISDGLAGQRGNRTMGYDALDRLTQTVSPMFGTATFGYDAVDNLRAMQVAGGARARSQGYVYDASNRLTAVTNSAGATILGLQYDVQGNLSLRGSQAFQFDVGNRLRAAAGLESYRYDVHGRRVQSLRGDRSLYSLYGHDGVLRYQRDEHRRLTSEYVYLAGRQVARIDTPIPLAAPSLNVAGYSATGHYFITWTSTANAIHYQLDERANGGSWLAVHVAAPNEYTASGRASGAYEYRVRACDAEDCGDWSQIASVAVLLPPAGSPQLSAPAVAAGGTYTVAWTHVAGSDRYELEEQVSAGAWSRVHDSGTTGFAVAGRAAGDYGYRVRACNASGCGPYSPETRVQAVHAPTEAPGLLLPASSYDGAYGVSWSTVGSASRYELEQSGPGAGWALVHNGAPLNWGTQSQAAGQWHYRVRACNAGGCGPVSAEASIIVVRVPVHAPVTSAPASTVAPSHTVTWTLVEAATEYRLDEWLAGRGWLTLGASADMQRVITDRPAGTYIYRVQACNVAGCGPYSAEAAVQVQRPPAGVVITIAQRHISYGGSADIVNLACQVGWSTTDGVAHYELAHPQGNLLYVGPESSLASYNTGAYCSDRYVVRACNAAGCSAWSPAVDVHETRDDPPPPGNPGDPPMVPASNSKLSKGARP